MELKSLSLGPTKSKKPNIDVIGRFKLLENLYVEGHSKNIEIISNLGSLELLTLRSLKLDNLNFIENLHNLNYLDIKLGSLRDVESLSKGQNLEYLELWQVRGIESLDFLNNMLSLDTIFIQNLKHIKELPSLSSMHKLRVVCLESMTGLDSVDSLGVLMHLKELYLIDMAKLIPENLIDLLRSSKIEKTCGYFGSKKKNQRYIELLNDANINHTHLDKRKLYKSRNFIV